MAFLNALGGPQWVNPADLIRMIGAANGNDVPGFGGGANPDGTMSLTGGVMPNPTAPAKHSGFRNILGILGDSILQAHGRQPIYGPMHEKKQLQGALQNFLTDPDGAIQNLMQVDAPTAISLYKMVHPTKAAPEIVAELEAAGIDPKSPEGQSIIKGHLTKADAGSAFGRDLEVLGIDPHSPEARELYYGRSSPAGYLLKPPAGDNVPTVNSQAEYDALPNGARYRDSQGNPGIKRGGATASPSPTFP